MVNKNDEPHGFGRALLKDGWGFYVGQFFDGNVHGYARFIR